jgi:hypothetical protein
MSLAPPHEPTTHAFSLNLQLLDSHCRLVGL